MTSITNSTALARSNGLEALSHRSTTASTKSKHSDGTLAGNSKTPPAQAARALIETRSDLANVPFGSIVSLLARHEPVPATPGVPEVPPAETPDTADSVLGPDATSDTTLTA
jgi:hypothetical protein